MNPDLSSFINKATRHWHAAPCFQHTDGALCLFHCSWCTAFTHDHITKSWLNAFFQNHHESIVIHCYGDYADIYAKSQLDDSPVIAHQVPWTSEDFWLIGTDYLTFAFELDRRFGKKHLEKQFVREFRRQYTLLAQAFNGDLSTEQRQSLSLNTLLRIIFVAFLANRSALDSAPDFLLTHARQCAQNHLSIYKEFIRPLFFETLNRSPNQRSKRAKALGNIPFLNGGLFTPTQIESEHPEIDTPNEIWFDIFNHLIEPYAFNAGISDEVRLNLDPWMLGHIFETLMASQKRAITGSFYTPMPMARIIVKNAIQTYLVTHSALSTEQAEMLCNGKAPDITRDCAQNIEQIMSKISLLDPASGSGAFLQCALDQIFKIRTTLLQILQKPYDPGSIAKQILANSLFGIDILPMANQLCELRLWLELIRYYPQNAPLPPLPNLDLNILCGDTLIDLKQFGDFLGIHPQMDPHYAHLKRRYRTSTGMTKKHLKDQIQNMTLHASRRMLSHIDQNYERECQCLNVKTHNLFEHPDITQAQKSRLRDIERQRTLLAQYRSDDAIFSFDLQFADILEHGGFDIILGNPPWYAIHKAPDNIKAALRTFYKTALTVHCPGKSAQAADISGIFVEKSLSCVKPGGIIAMLLPNKLFTAPSYAAFRQLLANHAQIHDIHDWTDSVHNSFDATTYPASVIVSRISDTIHTNSSVSAARESLILESQTANADNPNHALANYFHVKRGLCTGANEIFIGMPVSPDETLPNESLQNIMFKIDGKPQTAFIEKALVHPVIKGANIRAFQISTPQSIVFTHQWECISQPLQPLPHYASNWINQHHQRLQKRRMSNHAHHAISGCCGTLRQMKVVWRDISVDLEACFIENNQILPINTVYYIPVKTKRDGYLLAAYLNSDFARQWCRSHAEQAKNGYHRYFAWVVESLPWIFDIPGRESEIAQIISLAQKCHHAQTDQIEILRAKMNELIESCRIVSDQIHPRPDTKTPLWAWKQRAVCAASA